MTGPTMALLKKKQAEKAADPNKDAVLSALEDAEVPAMPVVPTETAVETAPEEKVKKTKGKKKAVTIDVEAEPPVATTEDIKSLSQEGDILSDTVALIENLTDEEKAMKLAMDFEDKGGFYDFALGGVLSKIQNEQWLGGCEDFKTFVEKQFGFKYRKAVYLINIYNCISSQNLPYNELKPIGWKKLALLAPFLTMENYKGWLQIAKEMSVIALEEYIRSLNKNSDTQEAAEASAKSLSTKTFKLHEDQKELVDDALAAAKIKGNTEVDAVALEYICSEFISGSTVVSKKQETLSDGFDPKSANIEILRNQLAAAVQSQCSTAEKQITTYIGDFMDNFPEFTMTIDAA